MRIIQDVKLDFDDVLLIPQRTRTASRKEVIIEREFKFYHSPRVWNGIPIVVANMANTGTIAMADLLSPSNIVTALHKHYEVGEYAELLKRLPSEYVWISIGIKDKDIYRLKDLIYAHGLVPNIVIDVANGYTDDFVTFCDSVRRLSPDSIIAAGNVCTSEMVQELILHGGVDIVKVGIGPGCLMRGTRILLEDGRYKNIEEIKSGDWVINKDGRAVQVKRLINSGKKRVMSLTHTSFYKSLFLTRDHQIYVGDLSSSNVTNQGYVVTLKSQSKTTPKQDKIKWLEAGDSRKYVCTLPSNIDFNLPTDFKLNLSDFAVRKNTKEKYNKEIYPTYHLGYIYGLFLGDGNASIQKYKNSTKGHVRFVFNKSEEDIAHKCIQSIKEVFGLIATAKLVKNTIQITACSLPLARLLKEFGKKTNKHLPDKYWCGNQNYIRGIYDGLTDSDGHIAKDGSVCFTNTSISLIELYNVLCFMINGSFPNNSTREKTNGGLKNCNLNNVRDAYICRLNKSHKKRHDYDKNLYYVKLLRKDDYNELVDCYDLEIDDDTHSFIANNIIVHNSHCSTRMITGVGYPQLSTIIECAHVAHGLKSDERRMGLIMADGGCKIAGDVCKAFAANADFVMLGGMFMGCDENEGEWEYEWEHPNYIATLIDDEPCKTYWSTKKRYDSTGRKRKARLKTYGMSSYHAQKQHTGNIADYRASEGEVKWTPYKGSATQVIHEILGGIRSCCAYIGATSIKDMAKCAEFCLVNRIK